jgi:deazaflavin-dependent oxidoreductase (nitroreductase family)
MLGGQFLTEDHTMANEIPENRAGWIKDHQRDYLASNGENGHMWRGVPTLLLTTIGAKSGNETTTPLIYGRSGDAYLVVASKGGAPTHPLWYRNLDANPSVKLQVGSEVFDAKARTASEDEKLPLWNAMAEIWPAYNEYQEKTERPIPVVIIERA